MISINHLSSPGTLSLSFAAAAGSIQASILSNLTFESLIYSFKKVQYISHFEYWFSINIIWKAPEVAAGELIIRHVLAASPKGLPRYALFQSIGTNLFSETIT